jgi:perosamine synthetase
MIARGRRETLGDVAGLELPPDPPDRIHSWHLYPVRLHLDRLDVDRDAFLDELRKRGVGCSVHWRPLHLHPYYAESFGWRGEHFPVATREWQRLVSLPIFPGMREEEEEHVVRVMRELCRDHGGDDRAGQPPRPKPR